MGKYISNLKSTDTFTGSDKIAVDQTNETVQMSLDQLQHHLSDSDLFQSKADKTNTYNKAEIDATISIQVAAEIDAAAEAAVNVELSHKADVTYVDSELETRTDTVDSIVGLKAYTGQAPDQTVFVRGYYSNGDGGGGTFYWDAASTEADNGGTIIAADAGGTGRWKRVYSGAVNVRWFGAKGDGSTDDTGAIQAAIDYALAYVVTVYAPRGIYIAENIVIDVNNVRNMSGGLKLIGDIPQNYVKDGLNTSNSIFRLKLNSPHSLFTTAGSASSTGTNGYLFMLHFENFGIHGNGNTGDVDGLWVKTPGIMPLFKNLNISGFKGGRGIAFDDDVNRDGSGGTQPIDIGHGTSLGGSWDRGTIDRCIFFECNIGLFCGRLNNWNVTRSSFENMYYAGCIINRSAQLSFSDNLFQYNRKYDFKGYDCRSVNFSGTYFENSSNVMYTHELNPAMTAIPVSAINANGSDIEVTIGTQVGNHLLQNSNQYTDGGLDRRLFDDGDIIYILNTDNMDGYYSVEYIDETRCKLVTKLNSLDGTVPTPIGSTNGDCYWKFPVRFQGVQWAYGGSSYCSVYNSVLNGNSFGVFFEQSSFGKVYNTPESSVGAQYAVYPDTEGGEIELKYSNKLTGHPRSTLGWLKTPKMIDQSFQGSIHRNIGIDDIASTSHTEDILKFVLQAGSNTSEHSVLSGLLTLGIKGMQGGRVINRSQIYHVSIDSDGGCRYNNLSDMEGSADGGYSFSAKIQQKAINRRTSGSLISGQKYVVLSPVESLKAVTSMTSNKYEYDDFEPKKDPFGGIGSGGGNHSASIQNANTLEITSSGVGSPGLNDLRSEVITWDLGYYEIEYLAKSVTGNSTLTSGIRGYPSTNTVSNLSTDWQKYRKRFEVTTATDARYFFHLGHTGECLIHDCVIRKLHMPVGTSFTANANAAPEYGTGAIGDATDGIDIQLSMVGGADLEYMEIDYTYNFSRSQTGNASVTPIDPTYV